MHSRKLFVQSPLHHWIAPVLSGIDEGIMQLDALLANESMIRLLRKHGLHWVIRVSMSRRSQPL